MKLFNGTEAASSASPNVIDVDIAIGIVFQSVHGLVKDISCGLDCAYKASLPIFESRYRHYYKQLLE